MIYRGDKTVDEVVSAFESGKPVFFHIIVEEDYGYDDYLQKINFYSKLIDYSLYDQTIFFTIIESMDISGNIETGVIESGNIETGVIEAGGYK